MGCGQLIVDDAQGTAVWHGESALSYPSGHGPDREVPIR